MYFESWDFVKKRHFAVGSAWMDDDCITWNCGYHSANAIFKEKPIISW